MSAEYAPTIPRVAVVGSGVIGRSWAAVFARAGCDVSLFDLDVEQRAIALAWLRQVIGEAAAGRVHAFDSLEDALDGVGYVQESGPEKLEVKASMFEDLGRLTADDTILASSTSALDMTEVAKGSAGASRSIVCHPVNPPHVIPAVEVLGGAETSAAIVERTCAFLESVGQTPVLVNKYARGFILNRLQLALLGEAFHLVKEDVADAAAIDAVVRDGLGLRWALMGPFGVANTNADGGAKDYFTRYRAAMTAMMEDLGPTPYLDDDLIEKIAKQTQAVTQGLSVSQMSAWRDEMIRRIRMLRVEHPMGDLAATHQRQGTDGS